MYTAAARSSASTTPEHVDLALEGLHCASCVGRVERALKAVPGVASATVTLATETAHVEGVADAVALVAAIKAAGYEATVAVASHSDDAKDRAEAEKFVSGAVSNETSSDHFGCVRCDCCA